MRVLLLALVPLVPIVAASPAPPVRGLHLMAPAAADIPVAVRFIKEALPKEGVNVLVLDFDYHFQFTRRPEVSEPDGLSVDNVRALAAACRQAGIKFIPEMNLLGHQSWAKDTNGLLRAHPEFDETPGKYPNNEGIYCRSYCPLHPHVHDVVFDLIDDLADAAGADAFHVGMDEVFLLGQDECSRCKGKDKAELFAGEAIALHDHLARTGRAMWMWGDRLLDGVTSGMGEWEASKNQTQRAVARIPKDVVICDWHYERALPTPEYFAVQGLNVLACPWRRVDVALNQLDGIRRVRTHATDEIASRMQGVLQTTWAGMGPFARAYFGEPAQGEGANTNLVESLECFRALFRELRAMDGR